MEDESCPRLYFHEWLTVAFIVGFFALCVSLTLFSGTYPLPSETGAPTQALILTVKGEVKHPGRYQVEKGTVLDDALQWAEPTPEANLMRVPLTDRLTKPKTLTLRKLPKSKRKNAK